MIQIKLEPVMSKKHKTSKPSSSGSSAHHRQGAVRKKNRTLLWIGLGIVLVAIAGFLLLSANNKPPTEISPALAYQKFQQGVFFLDVRSQAEWNQVHIPGSTLIPLDELQNRLSEVPRNQDVVVVCLSGKRSKEGMTILQQAGFSRAACMTGGLTAWKASGYPLEGSNP
jgi:rhodanese-related sulfurtransferase